MSAIPYLLYLFLVGLYVVILRDLTMVYMAPLNLPAFMVLAIALYKDNITAAWFGFAVGLVASAGGPPALVGWSALIMAIIAVAACYVRERLNLDSLKAKLLLVAGGVLAHNLLTLAIHGDWFGLLTAAPAGTLYTSILAWLYFQIKEGKITPARLKARF